MNCKQELRLLLNKRSANVVRHQKQSLINRYKAESIANRFNMRIYFIVISLIIISYIYIIHDVLTSSM